MIVAVSSQKKASSENRRKFCKRSEFGWIQFYEIKLLENIFAALPQKYRLWLKSSVFNVIKRCGMEINTHFSNTCLNVINFKKAKIAITAVNAY